MTAHLNPTGPLSDQNSFPLTTLLPNRDHYNPSADHHILLPPSPPPAISSRRSKLPLHPPASTDSYPPSEAANNDSPHPAIALLEKCLNDTTGRANAFLQNHPICTHQMENTMPAASTWDAILKPYINSPHTR